MAANPGICSGLPGARQAPGLGRGPGSPQPLSPGLPSAIVPTSASIKNKSSLVCFEFCFVFSKTAHLTSMNYLKENNKELSISTLAQLEVNAPAWSGRK